MTSAQPATPRLPGAAVPCAPAAVLVDDSEQDRGSAELITAAGLPTMAVAPAETAEGTVNEITECLADERAGLVLLDYRLEGTPDVNFRGGSVAAGLREHDRNWPVVLYTTAEKLRKWVEHQPAIYDLFDWLLLKQDIVDEASRARQVSNLVDIACSYARLGDLLPEDADLWDVTATALKAGLVELEPLRLGEEPPRTASGIGRWILRDVLVRVGPLINEHEARVMLGVTAEAFALPAVEECVSPARHEGVFSKLVPRWWRDRLASILADAAIEGDAHRRAQQLSEMLGVQLEAEGCTWCGQFGTVRACSMCGGAVDAAHALTSLEDPSTPWKPRSGDLPRWAAQPLVCFRCVVQGRAEELRFPRSSEEIAEMLRSSDATPPAADRQRDDD